MRLVTFQGQSGPAIGVRLGDKVIDLSKAAPDLPIDMIGLLEGGESSLAKAKAAANNAADDAKVQARGHAQGARHAAVGAVRGGEHAAAGRRTAAAVGDCAAPGVRDARR